MRCPYCDSDSDRVLDTRSTGGGRSVRRRRECLACGRRYTTHEAAEERELAIVKKDQRREPFDRSKVLAGLKVACQKRPVSTATLEAITDDIERNLYDRFRREVHASEIGEMVMDRLRLLDPVAYVRFASVYRAFEDLEQFRDLVDALAQHSTRTRAEDPLPDFCGSPERQETEHEQTGHGHVEQPDHRVRENTSKTGVE